MAVTTLDVQGEGVANEVIADALESLLAGQAGGAKAEGDSIDRLTMRLQDDASVRDRLILLEWAFLPALNDDRQLELHRSMATSLARFVEVLEVLFGPSRRDRVARLEGSSIMENNSRWAGLGSD